MLLWHGNRAFSATKMVRRGSKCTPTKPTSQNSGAKRVDKEMGQYSSSKLAEKSMTTIFMYSHSGGASVKDGATITDIKRAVCNENIIPAEIDTVIQKSGEKLAFLHQQNDRFLFKSIRKNKSAAQIS